MINQQLKGLPEGIYFNLPDENYHNDPAISNSDIKKLLISPLKYWRNSCMNPKKKQRTETPDQKTGKALHCYLMERERFFKDYVILPDKLEIDSDFYRLESKKSDFETNFEMPKTKTAKGFKYIGSKANLKETEFEEIKERVEYLEQNSIAGELFKDGYMEVSIFWRDEETGLMCKCRHDYLGLGYTADYKSIFDIKKIGNQIGDYDYYIQQSYYLEGTKQFKSKPSFDGLDEKQKEFVEKLLQIPSHNFVFVFQEKEDLLIRMKSFNPDLVEHGNSLFRQGLRIYKQNIDKYGVNMWLDNHQTYDGKDIETTGWQDLPVWIQYKYAQHA